MIKRILFPGFVILCFLAALQIQSMAQEPSPSPTPPLVTVTTARGNNVTLRVGESIQGIVSLGGDPIPVVMEAMTKLPDYYVNVICPVKSSLWLPQKRDRLIIIGSRRQFSWREPRARRRVSLAEILESDPQPTLPQYLTNRLNGAYRDGPIISDPTRGDLAPTCVAHYAKDVSTRLVVDKRFPFGVRPYTVREYARLQGVPDEFKFVASMTEAYRMIGNGVSVPVGRWIGSEVRRYFSGESNGECHIPSLF